MPATQIEDTGAGHQIGTSATQKIGFFGATPVVQPSGAAQAALGAATYAAPAAVPADLTGGESPTEAEHNAALATITSLRTQLIALAADVAALRTLVSAQRTAEVALGLIKGAA